MKIKTERAGSKIAGRSVLTQFVTAVSEGLADAQAGRVHPHAQVKKRMRARFPAEARRPRQRVKLSVALVPEHDVEAE